MGRSEELSEPLVGPLAEFAVSLQGLRLAAGNPSFDELGRRSEQPSTELAAAVSGRIVPSFAVTLAFVRACHGDEDEWALRWHAMQERLGAEAERAAAQQVAGQEGDWHNVPPADEWLAMASSLPSGEPLPPDEPLIRGELLPPAQWRPPGASAQPVGRQRAPDDPAMLVWPYRQPDLGESAAGPDARRFMEPAAQPIIELAAEPTGDAAAESVAEPVAPPAVRFPAGPDPVPMVERASGPPVVAGGSGPPVVAGGSGPPVVAGGSGPPVVAGGSGPPLRPAAPTPELWKPAAGEWPGRPAPPGEAVMGPATEPFAEPVTRLFVEPGGPADGGLQGADHTGDPLTPRSEPSAAPRDVGSAMPPATPPPAVGSPPSAAGSPPPSAAGSPPGGPSFSRSAASRTGPPPAASPSALPPLTPPGGPSLSRSAASRAGPPLPPKAGPPYVPSAAPHYVASAAPPYVPSAAPHYVRSSARTYGPPPLPSPDAGDFALLPMWYAEDQGPPPNWRFWDNEQPPRPPGSGGVPEGPEPPLGPRHAYPGPRHVQAGWRPAWPLLASALITVVAAGVGFGYLMSFHSGRVVRAAPSAHAASRHPPHVTPSVGSTASHATSQRPGQATPSAGSTPVTATPGVAVFPALAGVGCAPSQGTSAVTGTRSQGGDGWAGVHGGLPACGGQAIATRKTGALGLVQDTFTWTFNVGHSATCTAQIFIADANPSSGSARYYVYGDSLAPGARIGRFEINQASAKGQWVQEGGWQVRGTLSVQLTDVPAFRGDVYHVTASAAKANCS